MARVSSLLRNSQETRTNEEYEKMFQEWADICDAKAIPMRYSMPVMRF